MNVTVDLPDQLVKEIADFARRTGRQRRGVYTDALREYLARESGHSDTTRQINAALEAAGDLSEEQRFMGRAARETLKKADW